MNEQELEFALTNTDGLSTQTTDDQIECEESCKLFFVPVDNLPENQVRQLRTLGLLGVSNEIRLLREKHVPYLKRGLEHLAASYGVLDASRPWVCYWIVHALELLNELPFELYPRIIDTMKRCYHPKGGFGGGPQQIGHTATTYAACLSMAIIGTPEAYDSIDRASLYKFFMARKDESCGAFRAHDGGELDVRVTYCVISIASLYGILTPELINKVAEYSISCQSYEGGFGGEPGNEAHGGYAFCATATLMILNRLHECDTKMLKTWIRKRQMRCEGGYQGRTNKLVDGCYSFWQGSIPAMISQYFKNHSMNENLNMEDDNDPSTLSYAMRLQQYVLLCGQQIEGGLRDKPGKPRDYYHTSYCLSGLSVAQNYTDDGIPEVFGESDNLLVKTHPAYNIGCEKVEKIQKYFQNHPKTHVELMK